MAVLIAVFVLHVWQCVASFDVSRPSASPNGVSHQIAITGVVAPIADEATVAAGRWPAQAGSALLPAGSVFVADGERGPAVGEVATTGCLVLLTVGIPVLVGPLRRWMLRTPVTRGSPGRGPVRVWSGCSLFQICVLRT
ncbi:hypothetical protein C1I95_17310 [Micromonospora craterilacus]|uniref:Uncharacterized protein n=2 Tax=Micromonospora craterilacus TaxID=1655439 RepID=A0A2W2E2Q4_9ACTN|nr:hypothetical protein C1I95_17310 [Micromonospora craterilacus]